MIVVIGASSGIGRATALVASAAGASVVAAARGEQALETLAAEAGPGEVAVRVADVSDVDQMRELASFAIERFGRVDTWAHVAGVVE